MLKDSPIDIFLNRALLLAPLVIVIVLTVGLSAIEKWAVFQILGVAIGEASVIQFILWILFFCKCRPKVGEEFTHFGSQHRIRFHSLGFTLINGSARITRVLLHLPGAHRRDKSGKVECFTAMPPADSFTIGILIFLDIFCCFGVLLVAFLIYYNIRNSSIGWPAGLTGLFFGLYLLCIIWSFTEYNHFEASYGTELEYFFMDSNPLKPYEGPELHQFKLYIKYRDIFEDKMYYTLHAELYLRNALGYSVGYLREHDLEFLFPN